MATPDLSPLYARTSDIIGAEVDGELVLLNPTNWNYIALDDIGCSIWTLLEAPRSLASLVDALMIKFDVDRTRCLSDAKTFLDSLIAQGLVAIIEG